LQKDTSFTVKLKKYIYIFMENRTKFGI
jgi:hypothetical protein